MANILYPPEELRTRILNAAKEAFLLNGIAKTEMNDIAARAGISRSTLYRFAEDKTKLAFMAAYDFISTLSVQMLQSPGKGTGFDKLESYSNRLVTVLSEDLSLLRFISEFDRWYSGETPGSREAVEYEQLMRKLATKSTQFLFEGMSDGSIRYLDEPLMFMAVLNETIMGVLTREFVRDPEFVKTYYERNLSIVRHAIGILLNSIKA